MAVKPRIDFERALASPDPLAALREAVATELHDYDADRDEVFSCLAEEVLSLRDAGREDDEETVTSVMDFMEGWSAPHMRL
jgi:hypothetical protein